MPQPEISPTRFTPDELKLISRALNFYAKTGDALMRNDTEAAPLLASRIYRENFRIGMDNESPLYKDTDSLHECICGWCAEPHGELMVELEPDCKVHFPKP